MSRRCARVGVLAIAIVTGSHGLIATQVPQGTLQGTVTDELGAGLQGVTVTATPQAMGGERFATTGTNGGYRLTSLPPGIYRVSAELEGYTGRAAEVRISPSEMSILDFEMQVVEDEGLGGSGLRAQNSGIGARITAER